MNTAEKHWDENIEKYLEQAYTVIRMEDSQELGDIVERWQDVTGGAELDNLWKALNVFSINQKVNVEKQGRKNFISLERIDSMQELDVRFEDIDYSLENHLQVSHSETLEWDDYPMLPVFVFKDHADRNGYNTELFESKDAQGVSAADWTTRKDKFTRVNLSTNEKKSEDRLTYRQWFGNPVLEDGTVIDAQEIYSSANRQNYVDDKWEKEFLTLIQRAERIDEAAEDAVENLLPELQTVYSENRKYRSVENEFEALRKNLELFSGDSFDGNAGNYIEAAVQTYHRDPNGSSIIDRFESEFEALHGEGELPYQDELTESLTGWKKRERKKTLLSHYLDKVWQRARDRYDS